MADCVDVVQPVGDCADRPRLRRGGLSQLLTPIRSQRKIRQVAQIECEASVGENVVETFRIHRWWQARR
jgi:hypothetical protein